MRKPDKKHYLIVCSQSRCGPRDVLTLGKLLVVASEAPNQVVPATCPAPVLQHKIAREWLHIYSFQQQEAYWCTATKQEIAPVWVECQKTTGCADTCGGSCGSLSRQLSHVCSEIRWSVGLLWMQRPRTVRCADGFGRSCGSLSRRWSHMCSEIR